MSAKIPARRAAPPTRLAVPLALGATLALLGGCSDGTGGAAGDAGSDLDNLGPSPIEPFVGVWDISGNFDGIEGDQALLVIRPVDANGRAAVRIHDFDEQRGCYLPPTGSGRVELDRAFQQRVFMNFVIQFDGAELALSGDTLIITYFDAGDVDGDGDTEERLVYRAPGVGLLEADIGPSC